MTKKVVDYLKMCVMRSLREDERLHLKTRAKVFSQRAEAGREALRCLEGK